MQNIDFTPRIRRNAWSGAPQQPAEPRPDELKRRNRLHVLAIAALIFAFTLGLVGGIQIGRLKSMEASVVRYPDECRSETSGVAGAGGSPASDARNSGQVAASSSGTASDSQSGAEARPESGGDAQSFANAGEAPGRYLIKLGAFQNAAAGRLTARLNTLTDLSGLKSAPCKDVPNSVADGKLAFDSRVSDGSDRRNVFVGCFRAYQDAERAMEKVRSSGIPGSSGAQLYEIE